MSDIFLSKLLNNGFNIELDYIIIKYRERYLIMIHNKKIFL